MALAWLIYISKSSIDPSAMDAEIARIVARSCVRNEARGITGALIASPVHMAQYMEGPADAVDRLIGGISLDSRHRDVRVIATGERAGRLFPDWSMAYVGGSVYVRRSLARLVDPPADAQRAVARVLTLMREFARPLGQPGEA